MAFVHVRLHELLLVCAAASLASCDAANQPFDRTSLLDEVTTTLILPAYEDEMTTGATLATATDALCDARSAARLSAAQAAWRDAIVAWHAAAPFALDESAAISHNYDANLTTTADVDALETLLVGTSALDEHSIAALASAERGYATLEYLLFAYPDFTTRDDARTLAALDDTRRCQLARGAAHDVATMTAAVYTDWTTHFAADFTSPDGVPFTSTSSASNALVGSIGYAIDQTRDRYLGRPLGRSARVGGVETPYAGISVLLMQTTLESADHAWSMTPHSLDALMRSRDHALADDVRARFASARTALVTLDSPPLPEPFERYVTGTDLRTGIAAYAALVDLEDEMTTDASAILGYVRLPNEGD